MLFLKSGNRCAFPGCLRVLTAEASTLDPALIIGEVAHIVGASPDGPRGCSPLTLKERNRYDNLILLCPEHHQLIDNQPHTFTVERLHQMRQDHEKRIEKLLQHGQDSSLHFEPLALWRGAIHDTPIAMGGSSNLQTIRTKAFVSYSRKDKKFLTELQSYLYYFERSGVIEYWVDTKLKEGASWFQEIQQALAETKVAILLVSQTFLISDFIAKHELPQLLAAAKKEGAIILPVIIKPCFFEESELYQFQAFAGSKPLSTMSPDSRAEIWMQIARRVKELLQGVETKMTSIPLSQPSTATRGLEQIPILTIDATAFKEGKVWQAPYNNLNSVAGLAAELFEAINLDPTISTPADTLRWVVRDANSSKLIPEVDTYWLFTYPYAGTRPRMKLLDSRSLADIGVLPSARLQVVPFEDAIEKESIFEGSGSGTYSHGLGDVPDKIIIWGRDGSRDFQYDQVGSVALHITSASPKSFVGRAIKFKRPRNF